MSSKKISPILLYVFTLHLTSILASHSGTSCINNAQVKYINESYSNVSLRRYEWVRPQCINSLHIVLS